MLWYSQLFAEMYLLSLFSCSLLLAFHVWLFSFHVASFSLTCSSNFFWFFSLLIIFQLSDALTSPSLLIWGTKEIVPNQVQGHCRCWNSSAFLLHYSYVWLLFKKYVEIYVLPNTMSDKIIDAFLGKGSGIRPCCFYFPDWGAEDKDEPVSWRQFNKRGLESWWEAFCNRRSAWTVLSVCKFFVSIPLKKQEMEVLSWSNPSFMFFHVYIH